jgi:hypothetical protein
MRAPSPRPLLRATVLLAAAASLISCVEPFDGSKVEILLRSTILLPGDDGRFGRPPSDTHFVLYAVKDESVFPLRQFDVKPVINRVDRCFIEEEGTRFPGLHSTRIEEKLRQVALADGQVTAEEAGDIATAQRRLSVLPALEAQVRVITAHEPGLTDRTIATFQMTLPPPEMIDDATNLNRLGACRTFFAEHPEYYVGTDKRLAIPINGVYFGVVEGRDPRNNGNLGGAAFDVPFNLDGVDALRLNWDFNDPNDTRRPMFGDSTVGYHYMSGRPTSRLRGVTNFAMRHVDVAQNSGEIAIFTNIGDDEVNF